MIYITGDCHGCFDRFFKRNFPEQSDMNKSNDFVIVAGDFGGIWYPEGTKEFKSDENTLDQLVGRSFTLLFLDGNHEHFPRLYSYPVKEWHGGKVHEIRPNILHLMRGEIYEICGKKIFTFGGASSHDIQDGILTMDEAGEWKRLARTMIKYKKRFRIEGRDWWPEELPSQEELDNGIRNLEKHNWKVDYIVTHCPPWSILNTFGRGKYPQDRLTDYLQEIKHIAEYDKWIFGHVHRNQNIGSKYIAIYEQIIRIA